MKNIALTGKARSGKDTVASVLVEEYGYRRIAFADALKEMALEVDPKVVEYVTVRARDFAQVAASWSLSEIVTDLGWERAKDTYPEVRRFLQQLGSSVRKMDPWFWVRIAEQQIMEAEAAGQPVVITDARYINEAGTLKCDWGFSLIRIIRPGIDSGDTHESETEMDGYGVDYELLNDSDVAALRYYASTLTRI